MSKSPEIATDSFDNSTMSKWTQRKKVVCRVEKTGVPNLIKYFQCPKFKCAAFINCWKDFLLAVFFIIKNDLFFVFLKLSAFSIILS